MKAVKDLNINENTTIKELINQFSKAGGFSASKVAKAAKEKVEEAVSKTKKALPDGVENEVLEFVNAEPRTIKDVAKYFKISNGKAKKIIDHLKKVNHLVPKGKKGRMRLWEVGAETKRLMVES